MTTEIDKSKLFEPFYNLPLTDKSHKMCVAAHSETISDVLRRTDTEWLKMRTVGIKAVSEKHYALVSYGLNCDEGVAPSSVWINISDAYPLRGIVVLASDGHHMSVMNRARNGVFVSWGKCGMQPAMWMLPPELPITGYRLGAIHRYE